jgi:hypothetical protein
MAWLTRKGTWVHKSSSASTTRLVVPGGIEPGIFYPGAPRVPGTALAMEGVMPHHNPFSPVLPLHTLPMDRLDQARHLTRELDRLLRKLHVEGLSENAADLIEAARASNAATRTLLRHANLPRPTRRPVPSCATRTSH